MMPFLRMAATITRMTACSPAEEERKAVNQPSDNG